MSTIKESAEKLNLKLKEYLDKNQAAPKTPLCHYTTFSGLTSILQDKNLWLTDHKFLNDPSEIEHGKLIILNHIKNHIPNNKQLSRFMIFFFNDIITRGYKTFITSFCKEGDYLPAWRYYGNDGAGFSIGFKKEYFTPNQNAEKRSAAMLFEVEYEENSSSQVKEIFEIADSELSTWTTFNMPEIEPFLDALMATLLTIIPSIKHPDYRAEQEWRLCIPRIYFENENRWRPYDLPIEDLIIDKADSTKIPPFLKTFKPSVPRLASNRFCYSDIQTICVGPRLDFITAKISIEKILLDGGISESELRNISILKSTRPYQ